MKTYYLKQSNEPDNVKINTEPTQGLYINKVLLRAVKLVNQYYHSDDAYYFDCLLIEDWYQKGGRLDWVCRQIEGLTIQRYVKKKGWQPIFGTKLMSCDMLDRGSYQQIVREFASRSDEKIQPLDYFAALWMVDYCNRVAFPQSLSGRKILEVLIHDEKSAVSRMICFQFRDILYRILLKGKGPRTRRTGDQMDQQTPETTDQTPQSIEYSRRLKVRTDDAALSSTMIALDLSLHQRTDPELEGDHSPEF